MTVTVKCEGKDCSRFFVLPLVNSQDESNFPQIVCEVDRLYCGVCGHNNAFPLMKVQPYPQKSEVPV